MKALEAKGARRTMRRMKRAMRQARDLRYVNLHVLKVSEGGPGQKFSIWELRQMGIPARPGYSMLLGHSGVEVPENFKWRAQRILFG